MKDRACKSWIASLEARLDGEPLSSGEERQLDEHLRSCAACAGYAAELEAMLKTAGEMRDVRYERDLRVAPLKLAAPAPRPVLTWALGMGWIAAALLFGVMLGRGFEASQKAPGNAVLVRFAVPVGEAESVAVVGDFTGWQEQIELQPAGGGLWVGEARVEAGRHKYVIVVDGEQMRPDPGAEQVVDDGFGGKSSVLDVGSI